MTCKNGHDVARNKYGRCVACARVSAREYQRRLRVSRPEVAAQRKLKWYLDNPGAKKEIDRKASLKYSAKHPDRRRLARSNWKIRNPGLVNSHTAARRAAKIKRTPLWANAEAIAFFYECCPAGHHVDHILPLSGKTVSGLHVENNLQWLPGVVNIRKGARVSF